MGRFRPAVKLALAAAVLLTVPSASPAQQAPTDRVSGLEIPVLPGQFVLRTQGNCLVIADTPFAEMTGFRWDGPCRFGVVHGTGMWRWGNNFTVETYEYGYRPWTEGGENGVDLRRTATQDWEHLAILSRDISDPEFDQRTTSFYDLNMVTYKTVRNNEFIQREMLFRRTTCSVADESGKIPRDQSAFLMRRYNFTKKEADRIAKYCRPIIKNLNYWYLPYDPMYGNHGFFFHVAIHETRQQVLPDNGGTLSEQSTGTRHSRLCTNLNSPYGCEAIWQPMLAEFLEQYDRMKAEEPARTAQAREEMRQRFAPLNAAWLRKIADLTDRP